MQFDDQPQFVQVDEIASRYLREYAAGEIDRLDVVYTKFLTSSRQQAVVETLLPLGELEGADTPVDPEIASGNKKPIYEFAPSAASILEEVVPTSFKVKLFKCFLDSAVSSKLLGWWR